MRYMLRQTGSQIQEENVSQLTQWRAHLRYLDLPEDWEQKK